MNPTQTPKSSLASRFRQSTTTHSPKNGSGCRCLKWVKRFQHGGYSDWLSPFIMSCDPYLSGFSSTNEDAKATGSEFDKEEESVWDDHSEKCKTVPLSVNSTINTPHSQTSSSLQSAMPCWSTKSRQSRMGHDSCVVKTLANVRCSSTSIAQKIMSCHNPGHCWSGENRLLLGNSRSFLFLLLNECGSVSGWHYFPPLGFSPQKSDMSISLVTNMSMNGRIWKMMFPENDGDK